MIPTQDWHGPLPRGWASAPLGALMYGKTGGTPESGNATFWCDGDEGLPWVAIGDMSGRDYVTATVKGLTPEGAVAKRLTAGRPGTLLFAMYASVGEVARLDIAATWNQAILGLTSKRSDVIPRFVQYVLQAIRPHLSLEFRSNTQHNLNAWQVRHLRIPFPEPEVQQSVANYLDRELREMDAVINAVTGEWRGPTSGNGANGTEHGLIPLLRERREALITASVTGRLDPATGIERIDPATEKEAS